MDDWRQRIVTDDDDLRRILKGTRTIAVLGAKADRYAPAYYVPEYLKEQGYEIAPVNPAHVGMTLHGAPVSAALADLPGPVDLVEVFRRPETLVDHAREIAALRWKPRAVWFQLGIRDDRAAEILARAGVEVVQDRCMMPEHCRLLR